MYENNYPNNYHYESGNAYQSNAGATNVNRQPQQPVKKTKRVREQGKRY